MSQENEPRANWIERARADILRPPTKAEMIFYGLCFLDIGTAVGLGEIAKVTQNPLWRVGFELFIGSSMVVGGLIAISEFMYFFTGIDSDMRLSGILGPQKTNF